MVIYKYRDWNDSFHKKILTENELFLASPRYLNDPFDCRAVQDFRLLNSDELKDKYAQKIVSYYKEDIDPIKVKQKKNEILNKLQNNIEKVQEEYSRLSEKMLNDHLGVISFSKKKDNILMWSHYANNHHGFCVGFEESKLKNLPKVGICGDVLYDQEFPLLNPLSWNPPDDLPKQTMYKAKDWLYENEYRITKLFMPKPPTNEDRKFIYPDNSIKEIILGLNMEDAHQQEIKAIASKKNISVFKVARNPFSFQMEISPVV